MWCHGPPTFQMKPRQHKVIYPLSPPPTLQVPLLFLIILGYTPTPPTHPNLTLAVSPEPWPSIHPTYNFRTLPELGTLTAGICISFRRSEFSKVGASCRLLPLLSAHLSKKYPQSNLPKAYTFFVLRLRMPFRFLFLFCFLRPVAYFSKHVARSKSRRPLPQPLRVPPCVPPPRSLTPLTYTS